MLFSHEQLQSILSTLPDPAFILTRSGRYAALFGGTDDRYYHDGNSLVGQTMFDVLHYEKANWFAQQISRALDSKALHIVEYTLSGSDVKGLENSGPHLPIWFEGRIQALGFQVDGEDAVVWVASNITEKNAIEMRLREQSETDALTGLFNRRKLLEALQSRYELFFHQQAPTTAMMFDVDNFKQINDELGHLKGDEVLSEIGCVCRNELGTNNILARLGGDEFVVLMPGTTCDEAEKIANLLRLRIIMDIEDKLKIGTTISGGLSEFWPSDTSCEDVLKRADDGLYQSKRDGRNRISTIRPGFQLSKSAVGM
ncbi:diguanylate cyclase [Rhizobium sp. KVB221]|uniref:diguanylate cyclase n=1 Tax=Rhizobium setariae TaxID=2801340 RepID=A0A937CKG2_9HYPH|nr:sensor domain-containing diguanylate cyclase [Rhizobium setariae]MBL0372110.1 diguanylate cyclase [Rhizobium setariae]